MTTDTTALDCGMDNVTAWKLGEVALKAGSPTLEGVGDLIDRGLILVRLLSEAGYSVAPTIPTK